MKVNSGIFKAYDIRGVYKKDFDEKGAFRIGQAFAVFLAKKSGLKANKLKIAIGRDNRASSPVLSSEFIRGVCSTGANALDLGVITTPMLYFVCGSQPLSGGAMITASHNSGEYNGFKFVSKGALPVSQDSGLKDIRRLTESDRELAGKNAGKISRKNILSQFAKFARQGFDFKKFKKFKIIIDTANAVSGIPVAKAFSGTGIKVIHLYKKLDGSFPNHQPNPTLEENLTGLKSEVVRQKADIGVAFDGDGDRVVFVDNYGNLVRADIILAILSRAILEKKPGVKILMDLRASRIVKEVVEGNRGIAVLSRVGHSFIKKTMREQGIYFGGELAAHYYFQDNFYCEAPFFVLFSLLEYISRQAKPLSQLALPLYKYSHSGEINFKVKNGKKILTELERQYGDGKILKIDGLRVDYPDWWFSARLSNTEPLLRLIVEAKDKILMEEKIKEIKNLII